MLVEALGGQLVLILPNRKRWLAACCPTDDAMAMPAAGGRAKAIRRFSGHANLDEGPTSNDDVASWVADALWRKRT